MRELHSNLYCVFCGMKSLKPMREVDEKQEIKLLWPNKNNDKNLAVANKDASSGAEAYNMSLSLAEQYLAINSPF